MSCQIRENTAYSSYIVLHKMSECYGLIGTMSCKSCREEGRDIFNGQIKLTTLYLDGYLQHHEEERQQPDDETSAQHDDGDDVTSAWISSILVRYVHVNGDVQYEETAFRENLQTQPRSCIVLIRNIVI